MQISPSSAHLGLAWLLSATGCTHVPGADTQGEAETASSSTSAVAPCPDHASVDDCCCLSVPPSGYGLDVSCPSEPLCSRIGIQCENGLNDCTVFSAAEEVACLLDAMANRRIGALAWDKTSLTAGWGVDKPTESVSLYLANETAILVRYHFTPERTDIADITLGNLKKPPFFQDCAAVASLEAQMACIEDGFESIATTCLAGYGYPTL